jgi:hypothetical protein
MGELKNKAKNVELLPSQMPIEGYVRLKMRCVCCRRLIQMEGEVRKEDAEEIVKSDKPLCQNCGKYLKIILEKQKTNAEAEIKGKVEQFRKWLYEKPLPKSNGYQAEAEIRLKFGEVFGEKTT